MILYRDLEMIVMLIINSANSYCNIHTHTYVVLGSAPTAGVGGSDIISSK